MTAHLLLPGALPIIVTAPHAVEQERNGKLKFAEPATGRLANHLHESVGVTAVIKTDADKSDPNADERSPFRDVVVNEVCQRGIVAGIDLHQMSPRRDDLVILGTGHGRNIHGRWDVRDVIVSEFSTRNVPVRVDEVFPAAGAYRVSSDVARRTGIPYVQMEMNSAIFNEGSLGRMPEALERIVSRLAETLA